MKKLLDVLGENIGYTVVLVLAIILFFIFSGSLVKGLITAFSAVIAYACIVALFRAYRATPTTKTSKKKTK